jgi:hypothetical protein
MPWILAEWMISAEWIEEVVNDLENNPPGSR